MKKINTIGVLFNVLVILATVAAEVCYLINCRTAFFKSGGIDSRILVLGVAAVVDIGIYLILAGRENVVINGLLPIVAPVLLMVMALVLVGDRVLDFSSIITFDYSPQNMADLTSALASFGCMIAAVVVSVIAAFLRVRKQQPL